MDFEREKFEGEAACSWNGLRLRCAQRAILGPVGKVFQVAFKSSHGCEVALCDGGKLPIDAACVQVLGERRALAGGVRSEACFQVLGAADVVQCMVGDRALEVQEIDVGAFHSGYPRVKAGVACLPGQRLFLGIR